MTTTITTKEEAQTAAERVTNLKEEYEAIKASLNALDEAQTAAEKRMKVLSATSAELPAAKKLVASLNASWLDGTSKKDSIRQELIGMYRAVLEYKKRT